MKTKSILYLFLFAVVLSSLVFSDEGKIDRYQRVTRHNVTMTELMPNSPLSVGNGRFCFTVDITGLQTFREAYTEAMPLTTMAEWGWHSFENTQGYKLENTFVEVETYGRKVPYNLVDSSPAGKWLRANSHQITLANIGLVLKNSDGSRVQPADLRNIDQQLNLWQGIITSRFTLEATPVTVTTLCHPGQDLVAVRIESPLLRKKQLTVAVEFPYASATWGNDPADWSSPEKHTSRVVSSEDDTTVIARQMDAKEYTCAVRHASGEKLTKQGDHQFELSSDGNALEFCVQFTEDEAAGEVPSFAQASEAAVVHWKNFWNTGGAIDLSGSSDPRWKELERRIVLSEYLTAIQSAQKYPPAETGLTCNSWFGKFHLEMHWWHGVHFPLWSRGDLFEQSLGWYEEIMPEAKAIAQRQSYRGVRWPKMVDPSGQDSPSGIGPLLLWQQPHPIYYAELVYRQKPTKETLKTYQDVIFQTAEFMASYARWNADEGYFELGPPLISAREFNARQYEQNKNGAFELAYWQWGLDKANEWRQRLGMSVNTRWDAVARQLAPLPVREGVYIEQEQTITDDGGHPCMLGALGILPDNDMVDRTVMLRTLEHVLGNWAWEDTWGWDYPMMAMTAARLGRGDLAIDSLLIDTPKNRYLPNGHNYQRNNLPLYLPGNGGLLTAVAMMAAGWDNGPDRRAPGFPDDGTWTVRYEKLRKMP